MSVVCPISIASLLPHKWKNWCSFFFLIDNLLRKLHSVARRVVDSSTQLTTELCVSVRHDRCQNRKPSDSFQNAHWQTKSIRLWNFRARHHLISSSAYLRLSEANILRIYWVIVCISRSSFLSNDHMSPRKIWKWPSSCLRPSTHAHWGHRKQNKLIPVLAVLVVGRVHFQFHWKHK